MARTTQPARKLAGKRAVSIALQSSDMPDAKLKTEKLQDNAETASKISLGGFTSKKDRKRKRAVSPSSDSDADPLSLRKFESPMASRIKKEERISYDELLSSIPEFGKEIKPPSKKLKVEFMGDDTEIEPRAALEKALNTDVSMQQTIEMVKNDKLLQDVAPGEASCFESFPDNDDDGPLLSAIPQNTHLDRATMTPLNTWFGEAVEGIQPPQKTKKQLRLERQQAEKAKAKAKRQQKAERKKAAEAAALAKKQQKEGSKKKKVEAAKAISQAKTQQIKEPKRKGLAAGELEIEKQQNKEVAKATKALEHAQPDTESEKSKMGKTTDQMTKSERSLANERQKMLAWSKDRVDRHVTNTLHRLAVKAFKLTDNLEIVLKGLNAAKKAVKSEHDKTKAHSMNKMRQTQGKKSLKQEIKETMDE